MEQDIQREWGNPLVPACLMEVERRCILLHGGLLSQISSLAETVCQSSEQPISACQKKPPVNQNKYK